MRIFRRDSNVLNFIDNIADDLQVDTGILNRSADAIDRILDDARGARERLQREIAERQDELRETNIAISAFEAAQKLLEAGADPEAQPALTSIAAE